MFSFNIGKMAEMSFFISCKESSKKEILCKWILSKSVISYHFGA